MARKLTTYLGPDACNVCSMAWAGRHSPDQIAIARHVFANGACAHTRL